MESQPAARAFWGFPGFCPGSFAMDNPMHFECSRESARVIPGALAMSVLLISLTPIMAAPAKSSASSQDLPAYRSNSNLVLLDVVVRDKLGRPVAGLKQSDFEVFEDRQKQSVVNFDEHISAGDVRTSGVPPLPADVYSNSEGYNAAGPRAVILIDALNSRNADLAYAREGILGHLDSLPAQTSIAIFALGTELRLVQGFTTDRELIGKRLGLHSSSSPSSLQPGVALVTSQEGTGPAGNLTGRGALDSQAVALPLRIRIETTLDALEELALYLGAIPGRKSLIWLSDAFPIVVGAPQGGDLTDFADRVQDIDERLTRARVAIYPVDPRGLMTMPSTGFSKPQDLIGGLQGAVILAYKDDRDTPMQWWDEHSAMLRIADETGGHASFDTNAVGEAVTAAIADGADYYTLTYVPPKRPGTSVLRHIEVRVKGDSSSLAYRHSYFTSNPRPARNAPGKAPTPITAALLHGAPLATEVTFNVQARLAADQDRGAAGHAETKNKRESRFRLEYSIDPLRIQLLPAPRGARKAELEIAQSAYALDGRRVASTDLGLEVLLSPQEMAEAAKDDIRVLQEIGAPESACFLRLAVRDATSGRIGSLEIALPNSSAKP